VEDIIYNDTYLLVSGLKYPIIDDVIVMLEDDQIPLEVMTRIQQEGSVEKTSKSTKSSSQSKDIQYTFSEEWKTYNEILPEHEIEFDHYFDLVDLETLNSKCICDLGCGIGRWAYFLRNIAKDLVLVDFSESIFEARNNLSDSDNVVYIMADIKELPFKNNSFDFIYSLGVLHHIDIPALDLVRKLSSLGDQFLVYLYYSLDNKGSVYRAIFNMVNMIRIILCKIRNKKLRAVITEVLMWISYIPLISLGKIMQFFSMDASDLPIYNFYKDMSLGRIRQDVYDRFFTGIEQRVSKKEIEELSDTFSTVKISNKQPLWHALLLK